ncbi:MAG: proliferating cell nuclear antigen (pcna) [Candidatus Diapherotrites archaeon]
MARERKVRKMIELELADATLFKRCIDSIAVLVDEAEFLIGANGLTLKATDPSQISMVDFELGEKAFKKFKVERQSKIGVDLDYLSQIMSRAKAGEELRISVDEKATNLLLEFSGKAKRSFSLPLIDVSSVDLPSPKIDFDAEIKINASVIQDGLKDASLIGTHISLGVDAEKFFMKAHSSKGTLNHETTKKEKTLSELKVKKEAKAMFPLDYLADMLKAADSGTEIDLNLKANAPVRISYKIGEATITYFLAPRIESD